MVSQICHILVNKSSVKNVIIYFLTKEMIHKLNWQITKLGDKNGVTNISYISQQKLCKKCNSIIH